MADNKSKKAEDIPTPADLVALEQKLEKIKQIADANEKNARLLGKQVTHLQTQEEIIKKQGDSLVGHLEIVQLINAGDEEALKLKQKNIEVAYAATEAGSEEEALLQSQVELLEKMTKLKEEGNEAELKALSDKITAWGVLNKKQSEAVEAGKAFSKNLTGALDRTLGLGSAWKNTLVGSLINASQSTEAMTGALKDAKDTISNMGVKGLAQGAAMKTLSFLADATLNLARAQDEAIANFRLTTGLGKEYDAVITQSYLDTRAFGMTTQDVTESMGQLTANIASFTRMSKGTQLSLANLTSIMKQVGYGSTDMAAALDINISALGMLPEEAAEATREITTLALNLGIAPQQMGQEYSQLAPKLAAWGKNSVKVFKEVTAASKALSISSGELLSIVEQFDTFDSAADSVGSLNAVLGGAYFDTVEMVNASESERIRLLMEGVQATGESFGSLGRYQQKAIAAAAGITDMAEANKLFGQGLGVYDEMQSMTDGSARSLAQLSEKAKENMSLDQKMSAIKESLAISMRPVVDMAVGLAAAMQSVVENTGPWLPMMMAVGAGLLMLVTSLAAVSAGFLAIQGAAAAANLTILSGPVGWVLGAIAGIATIVGISAALMSGTDTGVSNVPKFASGGPVVGQPHSGPMGGVPIMAEGGEFVVKKSAVDSIGSQNLQRANDTGQLSGGTSGPRVINLTIDGRKLAKILLDNEEYGLESRLALREASLS